jgi:hypothetical protein
MCGFRLRGATERAPESPAVWITAQTPEPKHVTRDNSAAEMNINLNLLASRPDLLRSTFVQQGGDNIQEVTLL